MLLRRMQWRLSSLAMKDGLLPPWPMGPRGTGPVQWTGQGGSGATDSEHEDTVHQGPGGDAAPTHFAGKACISPDTDRSGA